MEGKYAKKHTINENLATGTGRSMEQFISETLKFILKHSRHQTQRLGWILIKLLFKNATHMWSNGSF